jgi:hypothetical protein
MMDYLTNVPLKGPEGRLVVHNQVSRAAVLGERGFRAWTEPVAASGCVPCDCGWAPWLPEHYRKRHWKEGS